MFNLSQAVTPARVAAIGLIVAAGLLPPAACAIDVAAAHNGSGDATRCCPLVELRQYTLHPNKLDGFIQMFEREFIETQEAVGITVIGHFRDQNDPNRFVWLRGFSDMPARAEALQAFYGGPVWKAHRDEANANFTDTDNVLLLRPVSVASEFSLAKFQRAPLGTSLPAKGMVVATVYYFDAPVSTDFIELFASKVRPELRRAGISVTAELQTEPGPNNFPRLPVREGENVFIWIATFATPDSYATSLARLEQSRSWRERIAPELARRLKSAPQLLRLTPAPRSLLHG
jgi:NIPSNAP